MQIRRVHVGLDYGTSTSKIVLRDYGAPGGEVAHVLEENGTYLFPSTAALDGKHLLLGCSLRELMNPRVAKHIYPSVKMRVAGEVTGDYNRHCHTVLEELPDGMTAVDIATLTVACLLSKAANVVRRNIRGDVRIGMTMGIPMSFFNDDALRKRFLKIARGGFFLWRDQGFDTSRVRIRDARQLLENVQAKAAEHVPEEYVRDWIRSEAEAAMYWAFKSPAIPEGPYAKLDLGAGTTNASCFRVAGSKIGGTWFKDRIAFFGAHSEPTGMDAIDEAIAKYRGIPPAQSISLRGKEEEILEEVPALNACVSVIDSVHATLRRTFGQWHEKCGGSPAEVAAWDKECRIFLIGGGSLVPSLSRGLTQKPRDREQHFKPMTIDSPGDLTFRGKYAVPPEPLRFTLVAYGLSAMGLDIPLAKAPGEIPALPDMRKHRDKVDHEDIYGT